jgi:hypothetical protein
VPRLAVGREGHDLVLVAGAHEAEMIGGFLVEQAQRVRQALREQRLHLTVAIARREMAVLLAASVQDEHAAVAAERCGQGG